jgi:hypothetical protein
MRAGQIAVFRHCAQWMVPARGSGWLCESPRCLRAVHVPDPVLRTAGGYRLRAELVRFVALPGRPELALAAALAARGARVVLYPGLDALDLVARWPDGYTIGADVKDWHKPYLLARKIKKFPRWQAGHPFSCGCRKPMPPGQMPRVAQVGSVLCLVPGWKFLVGPGVG